MPCPGLLALAPVVGAEFAESHHIEEPVPRNLRSCLKVGALDAVTSGPRTTNYQDGSGVAHVLTRNASHPRVAEPKTTTAIRSNPSHFLALAE